MGMLFERHPDRSDHHGDHVNNLAAAQTVDPAPVFVDPLGVDTPEKEG
jgi:hypothetical protein